MQDGTKLVDPSPSSLRCFSRPKKAAKRDAIVEMIHVNNLAVYEFRCGQCPLSYVLALVHELFQFGDLVSSFD